MPAAPRDIEISGKAGCITLLLSFAALQGGIVLSAWSLHGALQVGAGSDPVMAILAAAGVLLTFAGPILLYIVSRTWPRLTWQQVLAALPDLSLAAWFMLGWAAPHVIGRDAAGVLPALMVLEFIIIHASVGLVAFPQKSAREVRNRRWWNSPRAVTVWLLLLYSIGAAGISASVKTYWLFAAFWLMIGNKFIDDWLTPAVEAEERMRRHMARWATSAGLYLFLVFGSIFIPVPRLGAFSASDGDGHWETHPEQAVAMGVIYFVLLGFCELYGAFNVLQGAARSGSSAGRPG